MAMKENSVRVLKHLQTINGQKDVTARDVAKELDMDVRSVNGIFTGFQRKGLGFRVDAEVELEDGTHDKVKLLQLTDAGLDYDPTTEE